MGKNESGMAHLGISLLVIAVLSVIGISYWRVSLSNKSQSRSVETPQAEQLQTLPQNLQDLKTLDELAQITNATNGTSIISFVLESKDGKYIYKVVLSNGKKMVIDASTGEILSEEVTDVSEGDKIPAGIRITISPADAYKIAAAKSSSPVKKIEMEVEDKKVVYKIEYKDGSKIEINASSGSIVKSEIKGESKQEDEKDEQKEDKSEEKADNEDSDDSVDSEDHEEEDR